MDFDEEYRLLCSQQVRSDEDADPNQMIEEEKDQEISDEEEHWSQKPTSSYSELCQRKSKITIEQASVSALGQCSGSASVRVCDFCGKKFSSGKALGGHRRYHIQALRKMEAQNQAQQQQEKVNYTLRIKSKDLVIPDNDDNNNLIKSNIGNLNSSSLRCFRCLVCDKDFPSKKSLYGHMRSHPDRHWRGMEPPFITTADSTLTSSEEFMKVQDNGSSSSTSEESLSVPVDVSSSCSESWLKKDKRGRKSIGEAEAVHIAAQTLMLMHLYGNSHLHHRLPPHDEPSPEAAALSPVKKRKNVMTNHDCKEKIEGRDGNSELEARNNIVDMKVTSIINEKKLKNKKMKLGPEMIKSEEETVKQEEVKPSQNYVCDICNKSFTCFQALGGHKTKHRKKIVKSTKGEEVVEQRQEEEKVEEEEDKICINGSLLSAAELSGEEGTALIRSEETLAKNSNDDENNISNEEEVREARQQSGSKIRDFDLNVPYVLEHEATDV